MHPHGLVRDLPKGKLHWVGPVSVSQWPKAQRWMARLLSGTTVEQFHVSLTTQPMRVVGIWSLTAVMKDISHLATMVCSCYEIKQIIYSSFRSLSKRLDNRATGLLIIQSHRYNIVVEVFVWKWWIREDFQQLRKWSSHCILLESSPSVQVQHSLQSQWQVVIECHQHNRSPPGPTLVTTSYDVYPLCLFNTSKYRWRRCSAFPDEFTHRNINSSC